MADHQIDWQAILLLAERDQNRHATSLLTVTQHVGQCIGILGPGGIATDHLSNMSLHVVRGAAHANATTDVLQILREARNEQDRAIRQFQFGLKHVTKAFTHGVNATLRIRKARDDIRGI